MRQNTNVVVEKYTRCLRTLMIFSALIVENGRFLAKLKQKMAKCVNMPLEIVRRRDNGKEKPKLVDKVYIRL